MELFPAIDLRGGKCVRLYQGDYGRETVYGDDPVSQARVFVAAGAPWVHVVDLDAARTGEPVNRRVIAAIAGAIDVPLQVGGGVRNEDAAKALFDAGVSRVVVGTAALEDPAFVRRLAARHRVAVGLDAKGREVAVHGWLGGSGRDVVDVAQDFTDAGVEALVVTQIARDGTLEGPDLAGLGEMLEASPIPIVASGGVGTLEHLRALALLCVGARALAGAIVGRALYERRFSIEDAVVASKGGV
jgi:phosphoribosylformimino-5-aminoimidazole carboxamide ribotide isomerase